jgi:hypothetical protein
MVAKRSLFLLLSFLRPDCAFERRASLAQRSNEPFTPGLSATASPSTCRELDHPGGGLSPAQHGRTKACIGAGADRARASPAGRNGQSRYEALEVLASEAPVRTVRARLARCAQWPEPL